MFPEFPKFKRLEVGDSAAFAAALSPHGHDICEYAFANLIAWQDFDKISVAKVRGGLCVKVEPEDEPPFFLEPVGSGSFEEFAEELIAYTGKFSRVRKKTVKLLDPQKFLITPLRDHFDYVYSVREMAELKGRRFDGKRNHIKRFARNNPGYEYLPLSRAHFDDALNLFDHWAAFKKDAEDDEEKLPELAYSCQRDALLRVFENYDSLKICGGALHFKGKLMGFILGSRLNSSTICAHFSYTAPGEQGAQQTLFREACRKTFSDFEFVNLEQDLGLLGLRKTKESYYPVRLEEKFEVVRI